MKKVELILPDHTKVTMEDLEKMRGKASQEWYRADATVQKYQSRKLNLEKVIDGCTGRIRLLKILSKEG